MRCVECGADLPGDETCEDRFHALLLAEQHSREAAEMHGLTVLMYHFQHPLSGKTTWTQGPKEVDQFFLRVKGNSTSASSGGGFPTICFATVTLKVDDQTVATGSVFGNSDIVASGVLMDTGNKDKRKLTAALQSSNCDPTSHVDAVTVRGIGTG